VAAQLCYRVVDMAEPLALLAEVLAHPTDDAPRKAYADAVRATEPERAELIDLQLQLAHWRTTQDAPADRAALTRRERDLIADYGPMWGAALRGLIDKRQFVRGFVEHIWLDADKFVASVETLYARAPILHLDLSRTTAVSATLFDAPFMARIRSLSLFGNGLTDADATRIANGGQLGQLRWLDLGNNLIGPAGLEALVASPNLPSLRYLGFSFNKAPDPTPQTAGGPPGATAAALVANHGERVWLAPQQALEWPPTRYV